jgi:hypothetical protein
MNNYGKRLTKAEVFNALNAGEEQGAAERLTFARIAIRLDNETGFGVLDDGQVLQAVLIRRHPDIQREIRNEFPLHDAEGSDAAYRAAEEALRRAIVFLQEVVGVPHMAMLPFSYLLVVLSRFFALHSDPDPRNRTLLRRWYWRAAVRGPGIFPGGTTGASRIIGQRITTDETASVQGMLDALGERPTTLPVPNVRRRFRANEALSKLLLSSWWARGPLDPIKGTEYDKVDLALSLEQRVTASSVVFPVVSPDELHSNDRYSAANRVLLPTLDRDSAEVPDVFANNLGGLDDLIWTRVLDSHLMTPEMTALLRDGRGAEFLAQRQQLMHQAVTYFLNTNCEWGFEDTPPLADLVIGDDDADD